ncbi:MAG: hypothetical protein PHZ07_02160 [Patescibacteria group bacterium]|nr:hypothetical protein [Patescibacteria group bacterium]MDD4304012.1 hypothetical protein [Patescibacteria group bacterium]MDD4694889.1 hypothetical protein [Patescibacteria group bacterium]
MSKFLIYKNKEKIFNLNTKLYFEEVYKSYCSKNYRSAVVMLYSVVICDLIYKLQELRDIYKDDCAVEILKKISTLRSRDEKSPKWESELIELINNKTSFFENADYANLISLQQHRHLSAHPVLDQIDLLFSPNKETTRAHIRNMLEGILIKPPIFSRKIIDQLITDISLKQDIFLNRGSDLKKYLEAKYLKNLSKEVEIAIFKALWKFIFIIENEDCDKNRSINLEALKIIFYRNKENYLQLIKSESDFFSNISRGNSLIYLIVFLSKNREIYKFLNDGAKEIIKGGCKDDDNCYLLSWFIEDDILEHIKNVKKYIVEEKRHFDIKVGAFNSLLVMGSELKCENDILEFGIFLFGKSTNFNTADKRFDDLIAPFMNKYNKQLFNILFESIESNDQVYNRGRMSSDSEKIKSIADNVLGTDFDYSIYPEFMKKLNPLEYYKQLSQTNSN